MFSSLMVVGKENRDATNVDNIYENDLVVGIGWGHGRSGPEVCIPLLPAFVVAAQVVGMVARVAHHGRNIVEVVNHALCVPEFVVGDHLYRPLRVAGAYADLGIAVPVDHIATSGRSVPVAHGRADHIEPP